MDDGTELTTLGGLSTGLYQAVKGRLFAGIDPGKTGYAKSFILPRSVTTEIAIREITTTIIDVRAVPGWRIP